MGVHFNLQQGLVCRETENLDILKFKVSTFLINQFVPAQTWESLLGLLNQLQSYVPQGKLHLRPIQQNLSLSYRSQTDPNYLPVLVLEESKEATQWYMDRENFFKLYPVHQPTYQHRICSDASMEG